MHGMMSALALLMDSPLTSEQRELGSIIEESSSVLLQVINDILDYSKLSSGTWMLDSAGEMILGVEWPLREAALTSFGLRELQMQTTIRDNLVADCSSKGYFRPSL